MAQIDAGFQPIDMTTWEFPTLADPSLHRVPSAQPDFVELRVDVLSGALASLPHELAINTERLIGDGLDMFDSSGVPHVGVVNTLVVFDAYFNFIFEAQGLSAPVSDVIQTMGSNDPAKITALLTSGNDVLDGLNKDGGFYGVTGDHLLGGLGNDTIYGHGGNDTLEGGAGNDVIHTADSTTLPSYVAEGSLVDGGPGNDILSYDDATHPVVVDLTTGHGTDTVTNIEFVAGSSFGDSINGSAGADSLFGNGGSDTITGEAGDDVIVCTDAGPDTSTYLRGGDGNDAIDGGSGFDDINGNRGNDTIDGGAGGSDWLVGGQGDDMITAHAGDNILYGNLGNDTLQGGSGNEVLRGGQGDDSISGGAGNDWISGDRGNDTMSGGAGADIFHTFVGAGIDRVVDFNTAEGDRVQVDIGSNYTVAQNGADTVITLTDGSQMILMGVQMSTLPNGWIFVA